ncbi:MAG: SLC13 family permease [bacterium]
MWDRALKRTTLLLIFSILLAVLPLGAEVYAKAVEGGTMPDKVSFTPKMGVLLGLIFGYMCLFIWEPIRLDLISLSIPFTLMVLEPWTMISREEGLSGFSSTATITVLLLYVVSDAVRRTGAIQLLGDMLSKYFKGGETRQLSLISGLTGPVAGFLNNTSVVAIFIPMVSRLARAARTSPSKLMIPLSYASMLGGTLTLIGTSTNILASEISSKLLNHPFSMFEFTELGIIVLITGFIYLVTVGRFLIPERIDIDEEITEEYEMADFLTEVVVEEGSPFVGQTIGDIQEDSSLDFEIVQVVRNGEQFMEPLEEQKIEVGDHLIIQSSRETLMRVLQTEGLRFLPEIEVTQKQLEEPVKGQVLIETVITQGSFAEGESLKDINFLDRYDATVLAIRRGGELTHSGMKDLVLQAGDVLLLLSTERTEERLRNNSNFIVSKKLDAGDFRRSLMPVALGILLAFIGAVAFGLLDIIPAAIAGVLGMVSTGCVRPNEIYEAIDWEVIFLLAGLIPLGTSMQQTGTAQWLAQQVIKLGDSFLPAVAMLGMFYLMTAVLTNIISNNASVVLMIPVAVDAAQQLGLNPFSFVLAVTFAASTAFMSPVGYQTNLMVMGPGGYKFRDYAIAGAPLQILLTVVTSLGIQYFWGL